MAINDKMNAELMPLQNTELRAFIVHKEAMPLLVGSSVKNEEDQNDVRRRFVELRLRSGHSDIEISFHRVNDPRWS